MDFQVRLQQRAERDLKRIAARIHAQSTEAAAVWFHGLSEAILSLRSLPKRGAIVGRIPLRRHVLYGHKPHVYRIIYLVEDATRTVQVLQVRHGARRPIK